MVDNALIIQSAPGVTPGIPPDIKAWLVAKGMAEDRAELAAGYLRPLSAGRPKLPIPVAPGPAFAVVLEALTKFIAGGIAKAAGPTIAPPLPLPGLLAFTSTRLWTAGAAEVQSTLIAQGDLAGGPTLGIWVP